MSWVSGAERNREVHFALAGTVVVLLLRLWFALHLRFCGTPDSCSYLALAESLSAHHGFMQRFLFDYQLDRLALPAHGIEYWRPGTSFFLLLAKPFGGVTLHSGAVLSMLAGVVLSLAAWKIGLDCSGSRGAACASYLLTLVLPPMWFGSMTPDSVLFYGAAVAWFLLLFRVRFRSYTEDALAFFCLVIADLIRNDAMLLLAPVAVVLLLRARSGESRGASAPYRLLVIAGFLAAMIPMHAIDYAVLGEFFPTGAWKALWMSDLSDMSRFGEPVTWRRLLSYGVGHLILLRVETLAVLVYRIVFLLIGFAAIFLPLLAIRREREGRAAMPEIAGGASFAVTLVLVYSLVLPAIGISSLRSFCALLPLCAVLIVAGVRAVAGSRRVAGWLLGATLLFYFLGGAMEDRRSVPELNAEAATDEGVAALLHARGAEPGGGSLVMTGDPAQFSETTDYGAIPLPENGPAAARQAADLLGATHVLIDTDKLPGTLEEIRSALEPAEVSAVPGTHLLLLTLRARR